MKPSGPGLLFVGRFLIMVSISVLVIGLFIFSISSVRYLQFASTFPLILEWLVKFILIFRVDFS